MADVSDDGVSNDAGGAAPPPGTVLEGRYRLMDRLGEGGVGWVYRAEHLKLGTQVAIKMLQAPYQQHEMLRPRFEREAQVLASLRHPHIVTLTDYSIAEDGHPYLVMELLEGRTLGELMAEGPMEEARARRILRQMLDALIYAHGKGFAHRDLKPTNVFLVDLPTDTDHVKILDFGFVKLLGGARGDEPALTRSGIAFGTPSYMCPEQATGGATDPRADLYSTGIVFFEMLAGHRPYVGEIPEVIRQHLTEPVPSLDIGGAPIAAGPELRELLERAMAKEPRDRYQSAQAMRDALDALPTPAVRPLERVDGRAQTIPAPPSATEERTRPSTPKASAPKASAPKASAPKASAPVRRPRPRVKTFPILAGLVVAGCAAAIAWVAIGGGEDAAPDTAADPDAPASEAADTSGSADVRAADEGARASGGQRSSGRAGRSATEGAASVDPAAGGPVDLDFIAERAEGERAEGVGTDIAPPIEDSWDDVTGTDDALYGEEVTDVADVEPANSAEANVAPTPGEDPWASREPVPLLDEARRLLRTGEPLPRDREQAMRRYVREHRDDPRAHLVLARHFLAREHTLSAVQRYSLAYAVDPSARRDPMMLEDLVRLARLPVATDQAADLLARAYGDDALSPIEAALADDELEPAERRRLEAVRDRLRATR